MKKIVFISILAFSINASALDYTISFTGTGASTTVESVIVQNLTKGTMVTVPAGNTLNLVSSIVTSIENATADNENLRICQNAADGKSTVSFYAKQAGSTQLNVFGIDGRKVTGVNQILQEGTNSFELTLPQGVFLVQVQGVDFKYSGKIINSSATNGNPTIAFVGTTDQQAAAPQKAKSETTGVTQMVYATGDQLLYKATSGNYSTIVTDVPTVTKTTNFNFVLCQDADGNNYSVVTIGTQTWMAENLRTSKYRNGVSIPNVTDNTLWGALTTGAQCGFKNSADSISKYGRLYNFYAVVDTRNIAPTGWHVPTNTEWTTLTNYVTASAVGTSLTTAKALASTRYWKSDTMTGHIGNNPTLNNSTGFSALPSGYRNHSGFFEYTGICCNWWTATETASSDARNWQMASGYANWSGMFKLSGNSMRCVMD